MLFGFGFASTEKDFDPLNNKYIDIIPYQLSSG